MAKTNSFPKTNPIQSSEIAIRDLGEAAALLTQNIKLLRTEKDFNFSWFIFEGNSIQQIIHTYHFDGLFLDAKAYYENIKLLKQKLFNNNPSLS